MNNLPAHKDILNKPSFVICLKRNKVRFEYTKKLLNKAGFTNVHPFEAVDAVMAKDSKDEWYHQIRPWGEMFGTPFSKNKNGNWHTGSGGQFGMTMSLLKLWGALAISNKNGLMIFEDDALPRPDFPEIFPKFWNAIEEDDTDMVYIGSQIHPNNIENDLSSNGYYVKSHAQCMHAHYITKKGAKKILDLMPHISEMRLRSFRDKGEIDMDFGPIDTLLTQVTRKDGLKNEFEKYNITDAEIPDFKCIAFVGDKEPVKGEFDGAIWEGRADGIIHQNGDLASNIHGLDPARMRKEKETAESGKDVFHDGIFKVNPKTGEGYIADIAVDDNNQATYDCYGKGQDK